MVLGILQFQVLIHGAGSLKDKRRVVQSLKDRLHREHLCAVAEVGDPDLLNAATLATVVVAREGKRVGEVLDAITLKLRELRDGEVGEIDRQVLHGRDGFGDVAEDSRRASGTASESPAARPDPKAGDGSDDETDALIRERALEADLLEQIEREDRDFRSGIRGGDAA